MDSPHDTSNVVVFVMPQDYGHFYYTTHLAWELRDRGFKIEYWTHSTAEAQVPKFATFNWLSNDRRFTDFYCKESSRCDSDLENIERMSSSINQLVRDAFDDDPMINFFGNPDRVKLLKRRILERDVALCVNDKCNIFTWIADHCDKYGVPVLNLCPSQHEIQRSHAGVMDRWSTIFGNMTAWAPTETEEKTGSTENGEGTSTSGVEEEVYAPLYPPSVSPPVVPGLYITYPPLVPDRALLPEGRRVVGPVYMPESERISRLNEFNCSDSEARRWLDKSDDSRPVVYVGLGSMLRAASTSDDPETQSALQTLFSTLASSSRTQWRALVAIEYDDMLALFESTPSAEVIKRSVSDGDMLCAGWVPQFEVLGHPAVKAFISHCGANSVHEAIFHRVPIVAMPFFDDQRYNGPKLVELGLASDCLLRAGLTSERVVSALTGAFESKDIAANMVSASKKSIEADGLGSLVSEALRLATFSIENIKHRLH